MTAPPTSSPASGPVLAVDDLVVALGGSTILHAVSCRAGAGEVLAVVGANGSGKSTLIRAALGLVPHEAGSVRLFGTPLDRFRDWRRVGYVPQRSLLGMRGATVREVVATGRLAHRPAFVPMRRADREAVRAALTSVDLLDRARDPLVALSGGQQQRALIARALAGHPELLVLDEPTAGVDLGQQQVLADILRHQVARGLAVCVVLHETGPMAPLIDRTIVLEQGRVVHDGAPPHLSEERLTAHGHERDEPPGAELLHGAVDETEEPA